MSEEEIPRRINTLRYVPAETAISTAMHEVEMMTAHPLLTEAVCLLEKAKRCVADYVDGAASVAGKVGDCILVKEGDGTPHPDLPGVTIGPVFGVSGDTVLRYESKDGDH